MRFLHDSCVLPIRENGFYGLSLALSCAIRFTKHWISYLNVHANIICTIEIVEARGYAVSVLMDDSMHIADDVGWLPVANVDVLKWIFSL